MSIVLLDLTLNAQIVQYRSYATLAEATHYLFPDARLGPAWTALSADQQAMRLIMATRRLDWIQWGGAPAGGRAQDGAWPRTGLQYRDGTEIGAAELPDEIEQAAILLAGDADIDLVATTDRGGPSVRSEQIGRRRVEYFYHSESELELLLPGGILELVRFWLVAPVMVPGGVVTGKTTAASEFSETYDREVWEGE